jgi:hypothetical protein
MGFRRHHTTKKNQKNRATQTNLGCPCLLTFSVGQDYSLTGCSPAEPISAYPDEINIIPIFKVEPKVYPHLLGFR